MDQRIEKTYDALQAGMRELLGQVTWDEISVQRLCDVASVSRSTFYSHFKDKDDLLDTLLVHFETAMGAENNHRSLQLSGSFKFLPMLFGHVAQNRSLFAISNNSRWNLSSVGRMEWQSTRAYASAVAQAGGYIECAVAGRACRNTAVSERCASLEVTPLSEWVGTGHGSLPGIAL